MSEQTFWKVRLAPGVTRRNMAAFYLACLIGLSAFTFIAQAQALLLDLIGVAEDDQGKVSGHIGAVAEVVLVVGAGIWGSLSDRVGRRLVFVVGFLIVALGLVLAPFAGSVLALGAFRVVFAVGAAAAAGMISTVVSDFAIDEDRGRASGLLGVMNGIGAVLTVFLLVRLPDLFSNAGLSDRSAAKAAYAVVAAITVGLAAFLWRRLPARNVGIREVDAGLGTLVREGVRQGRDPGIALSFAAAFTSRGNLAVVGTFFTLWLVDYGTEVKDLSRTDALAKAGLIIAVAQTCALFAAPVFGVMADKLRRADTVIIACAVSAVGYTSTIFVDDPFGAGMYLCAVLIGIGEVGGIIASLVLIGQQAPPAIRGTVVGTYSAFGALGILTALEVGGQLFDSWRPAAPFILFGVASGAVALFGLVVRGRVVQPVPSSGTPFQLP